jgi:plastocyanin
MSDAPSGRARARLAPLALLALLACATLAACFSDDPSPTDPDDDPPTTARVVASGSANTFSPGAVTVARGAVVTWAFAALPHNVTFRGTPGAPANVPTTTNAEVARTFATAGTFPYDCTLHAGMTGTVVVQ